MRSRKAIVLIVLALLVVLVICPILTMARMMISSFFNVATIVLWALTIAIVIFLIVSLVGRGRPGTRGSERDHEAQGLLDERYARGEISRDEYERKKRDIG